MPEPGVTIKCSGEGCPDKSKCKRANIPEESSNQHFANPPGPGTPGGCSWFILWEKYIPPKEVKKEWQMKSGTKLRRKSG